MVGIKINLGSSEAAPLCQGLSTRESPVHGEAEAEKGREGMGENPAESREFSSCEAWLHSCPWVLGGLPLSE